MARTPPPRAEWESEDRSPRSSEGEKGDIERNPELDFELPLEEQLVVRRPLPPPLSEDQVDLAEALAHDLMDIAHAHSKFASFEPDRVAESAKLLVRYGLETAEAFRTTDELARKYLFEDLRRTEHLNFLQICFLPKLARHIPPHDQKLPAKNIRFTEIDIPRELSAYSPLLSNLTAYFLPNQAMVNWTQKEIAIAAAKDPPPYIPYLTPQISENPWMPLETDHESALTRWAGFSKQARRSLTPQELSIQAFLLYHLRFVFSADLCQAWKHFGSLGDQLSHLLPFFTCR